MRIGIITLNGFYNYGNRLQNYALQKFLEKIVPRVYVETIWGSKNKGLLENRLISLKNIRRYIFNRHNFKYYIDSNDFLKDVIREYNIKKFSDKYIKTRYCYEYSSTLNKEYDYFIVGSDQIWNPHFVDCKNEFLQFCDKKKRIAYSASIGINTLDDVPKQRKIRLQNGLVGMEHISVREKAGAAIVKSIINKDVPVLVDPTLLIEKEEWDNIVSKPVWYSDEEYILVFFLSDIPSNVMEEITRQAGVNKYRIINLMDMEQIDIYASSPDEFLYLIKNAKLVYTDSFHCTIFSIIMQVPFLVYPRENVGMSMESRIDTLLELFDLSNRKIMSGNYHYSFDPFEIIYNKTENVIQKEREKSRQYLLEALNIV